MCGLFGVIGTTNPKRMLLLANLNEQRGTDGTGFFDSSGAILKTGSRSSLAMVDKRFGSFIAKRDSWFIAGHTRGATTKTRGASGAHPFCYGSIIGSHNGIVRAPSKYAVDSEYIFDLINDHAGNYQTALENVSGWLALTWFDKTENAFYLLAQDNTIALGEHKGSIYYSSSAKHYGAAIGRKPDRILSDGEVIRFTLNTEGDVIQDEMPPLPQIEYEPLDKQSIFYREDFANPWYYDDKYGDELDDISAADCDRAYWRAKKDQYGY